MTPLSWSPTGTPVEQVAWPSIAPTEYTRTGKLTNLAHPVGDIARTQNLWITRVATGWKLAGATGQAHKDRIFYPRNLSQMPITIEGIMPNQHQYDLLVQFVITHQQDAISNAGEGLGANPVVFTLPENLLHLPGGSTAGFRADVFRTDTGELRRRHYRAMLYDGFITHIKAGHERFVYAPTFTMDMLISWDHLDEKVEIARQLTNLVQTAGVFAVSNLNLQKNYEQSLAGAAGWQGAPAPMSGDATVNKPTLPNNKLTGVSIWNPGIDPLTGLPPA